MTWTKRWWVGLSGAALLLGATGCGKIPDKGALEKARLYARSDPLVPANAPGLGNQHGKVPLGASSKYLDSNQRGGSNGLALNGLANPGDVRPPAPGPEQPQARTAGEVAFVPNTFDRLGFGMTARNGSNMRKFGDSYIRRISYTDPFGVQPAAQLPEAAPPEAMGVGGSGAGGREGGKGRQRGK